MSTPAYGIRAVSFANGMIHCPHAGEWLESFDHDAHNGRGYGSFTKQAKHAMRFADKAEAFEFWRKTSTARPWRPDGKPNRPLTALNIVIEELP